MIPCRMRIFHFYSSLLPLPPKKNPVSYCASDLVKTVLLGGRSRTVDQSHSFFLMFSSSTSTLMPTIWFSPDHKWEGNSFHFYSDSIVILKQALTLPSQYYTVQSGIIHCFQRARVVQCWDHSLPTNVAWVQTPASMPLAGGVCHWFCPCFKKFFLQALWFSLLLKN